MESCEEMTAIDHLYVLHNNPFIFSRVLLDFFEELGEKEHSALLTYLVLPIVLDKDNRDVLMRAIVTSNLRTFVSRGDRLRALPERVLACRENGNACLRYLVGLGAIEFRGSAVHVKQGEALNNQISPPDVCKAAKVLARFFKNHEVPTIFRMLGVMGI